MMNDVVANLLSKSDLLIVFIGMALLQWRVVTALDSLAQVLARLGLSVPVETPKPIPTKPTSSPPPTLPPTTPTTLTEEMVVDPGLVAYIKKTEAFRAKAYWDYKQYSIGYGTKATSANEVITEAAAAARLEAEIDKAYKLVVTRFPHIAFSKGQLQALTDLTFNAGPGWMDGALGKQVAAQKIDSIKADILLYNHAGGVVNDGLTKRREAEVSWFDNPL